MTRQFPPSGTPLATLTREDDGAVFVLTIHSGEGNNFSTPLMAALHAALDAVEAEFKDGSPAALVVTNRGKIFSNGLEIPEAMRRKDAYFKDYQILMERFLTFRMPTIAAINGHAFAGGLMFALAHDYRVMKTDRGFVCMNEIDLPAALTPGMISLIKSKIFDAHLLRTVLLTGQRFDGASSKKAGLVDAVGKDETEMWATARAIAGKAGQKVKIMRGEFYRFLKLEMYAQTRELLLKGDLGYVRDGMARASL